MRDGMGNALRCPRAIGARIRHAGGISNLKPTPFSMKIAYIINSLEGGGAQTPLPRIFASMRKAGAEVRLFALAKRDGRALIRLREYGIEPEVFEGGERAHFAAARWIRTQLRDWNAEAVWTSLTRATLLGQFAARSLGLPVVSWQHNAFLKPWNERLLRWRARAADLWVADSTEVAELTRQRLGVAYNRLITWSIFAADPSFPKARPWQPGQRIELGSLGRLHPNKGYDVLIEALALLNRRGFVAPCDWRIAIAGTGADHDSLAGLARARGVSAIEFVGYVDDPKLFLSRLHGYLQPSRREGFCIAAHEAMLAGLPVVVSRTGEMPHTVGDQPMGFVVEPENPEDLAAALAELLARPERLEAMGRHARERVLTRFSEEVFDRTGAQIVERLRPLVARSRAEHR